MLLQIREKESDIDALITPIEDMYSLLMRYEVGERENRRACVCQRCYEHAPRTRCLQRKNFKTLAPLPSRHFLAESAVGCCLCC